MKLYICLVILLQVDVFLGANTECKEVIDNENECPDTEYDTYMTCLRSRMKRSTCTDSCTECDCNTCTEGNCNSTCNVCCANFQQPCTNTNCCYKTCHSSCPSTDCRKTCRKSCSEKIVIQNNTNSSPALHNITTVINIRNIINNTNVIDMPVNVNNTNINNITIEYANNSPPNHTENPGPNCCHIISPRHCFPSATYPFIKCAHYRKHICNDICTAPTMHAQPHQVCDEQPGGPPSCHQQIIYIPQPQPRCSYQSTWPYVSCGLQTSNCFGCYSHYTSGGQPPSFCSPNCYNEGYGIGPYYRQGPFYRPGFAPVPSCLQTGTCDFGNIEQAVPYSNPGMPLSGVGYPPSTYENFYSLEVDPSTGLNFTAPASYDASELKVENELPQLDEVPELVKIETTKYPQSGDSDASVTITDVDEGEIESVDVPIE